MKKFKEYLQNKDIETLKSILVEEGYEPTQEQLVALLEFGFMDKIKKVGRTAALSSALVGAGMGVGKMMQKSPDGDTKNIGVSTSSYEQSKLKQIQNKRNRQLEERKLVDKFAKKMGINLGKSIKWKTQAGIPIEINGKQVPENLYSQEELNSINMARNFYKAMNEF